jgi:hypothetical protein
MPKFLVGLYSLGVLIGLAGCSALSPPPPPPVIPPPVIIVEPALPAPVPIGDAAGRQLAQWQAQLRTATPEAVAAKASQLAGSTSVADTVHLALVLLHTRNPPDTTRALALLDGLYAASAQTDTAWADWLPLLSARAFEQKRLEDQVARQSQQLRESQRRIDQLSEQLEALKAIERQLAPRNNGSKTP